MDIQELQLERDALQKRLRAKIQEELSHFYNATGIHVDSVSVYLQSVWTISKVKPDYFVQEVSVDLDF